MLHVSPDTAKRRAKHVPASRLAPDLSRESVHGLLLTYRGLRAAQDTVNSTQGLTEIGAEAGRLLSAHWCELDRLISIVVMEALSRKPRDETEAHQRGMIAVDAVARCGAWRQAANLAALVERVTDDDLPADTTTRS